MDLSFYDSKKKKVIDFIYGFLGFWIALVLVWGLLFLLLEFVSGTTDLLTDEFFSILIISLFSLLAICSTIFGFYKKRAFISIGIISAILIPLLIAGACFGVFFLAYTV